MVLLFLEGKWPKSSSQGQKSVVTDEDMGQHVCVREGELACVCACVCV